MSEPVAFSPQSSLNALRGAVGGVWGVADETGCWDRLVSIWRILWALDELMAVLWAIVFRLRAGDVALGVVCRAEVVCAGRVAVAGVRRVRLRAGLRRIVAGVRPVAMAGRARVAWARQGRRLAWRAPDLGIRGRRFSELAMGASRSCVLNVPI